MLLIPSKRSQSPTIQETVTGLIDIDPTTFPPFRFPKGLRAPGLQAKKCRAPRLQDSKN